MSIHPAAEYFQMTAAEWDACSWHEQERMERDWCLEDDLMTAICAEARRLASADLRRERKAAKAAKAATTTI